MPLIGGALTGNRAAYEYLPRTAAAFPAGEKFLSLMAAAGCFSQSEAHPLTLGTAFVYVGRISD
jgi:demethylmenaquinone methyltransferase/2-methoxy-6-polyprenyl-1,4-benzoquinol methylase